MRNSYRRYAVYDEDREMIRIFPTRYEADLFCLKNWIVVELEPKEVRHPHDIVGEAPF